MRYSLQNLALVGALTSAFAVFRICSTAAHAQQPIGLTQADVALIREAFYLQSTLGDSIWQGWDRVEAPFVYKTPSWDYLIHYPNPPNGFSSYFDNNWGDTVWIRANTDSINYQASFPINGIETVVISAPEKDYDQYLWVLKAVHEMFHIYQGSCRVVNPFVGPYADKNELTFPFDYTNDTILAGCRVEAELHFNLVTKQQLSPGDSTVSPRVFRDMQKLLVAVFADSLQLRYKRWIEWSEGTARYTERRLADLARNPSCYQPTKEFLSFYPKSSYSAVWNATYEGMTNPIRFVGEGVRGRTMFYYSGMAKAYVLDRIHPHWRSEYFKKTLDELLTE